MAQKSGRKVGRTKRNGQNLRYKNERRHEQSHRRRLIKHTARFPADAVAKKALQEYEVKLGIFRRA